LEESITLSPNHRENAMTLFGIADDEQLTALTKLLDDYSKEGGIQGDKDARDRLATRIMSLFNNGVIKPEDIRRNLDSSPDRWSAEQTTP
jgi:hypothetical protein